MIRINLSPEAPKGPKKTWLPKKGPEDKWYTRFTTQTKIEENLSSIAGKAVQVHKRTIFPFLKQVSGRVRQLVWPETPPDYVSPPELVSAVRGQTKRVLPPPPEQQSDTSGRRGRRQIAPPPEAVPDKVGKEALVDICEKKYKDEVKYIQVLYRILQAHIKYGGEAIEKENAEGFAKEVGYDASNLAHIFITAFGADGRLDEPCTISQRIEGVPHTQILDFIFQGVWGSPRGPQATYEEIEKKTDVIFQAIEKYVPSLTNLNVEELKKINTVIKKLNGMEDDGKRIDQQDILDQVRSAEIDTMLKRIDDKRTLDRASEIYKTNKGLDPYWLMYNTPDTVNTGQPEDDELEKDTMIFGVANGDDDFVPAPQFPRQEPELTQPEPLGSGPSRLLSKETNYYQILSLNQAKLQEAVGRINTIIRKIQGEEIEFGDIDDIDEDAGVLLGQKMINWPEGTIDGPNILSLIAKAYDGIITTEQELIDKITELDRAFACL